jgi:hypothetical protein
MPQLFNVAALPLLAETDVLVVGAGSAGCVAAMSAGREGRYSVALLERYGFPGGTSTQMLDTFYGFFTPGERPRKVVGGLPDEVVNALDASGNIFLRPNTYGAGTGITYNPERLKYVWDQLIAKAGVRYWLHTAVVDVLDEGRERLAVVVWHKSGFYKIVAKRVIDASGDADYTHLAGFACEIAGELEPAQSMTTTFRMANVNLERFARAGGKKMLMEKMAQAIDAGEHSLPRKEGSAHEMVQAGCVATVAVKVADLHALNIHELTQAEVEGRRQAFIYERFFREEIPGYEEAKIIGLSHQIGVRETRRVYGEHRLTKEDCMSGRILSDSILLCGAPIEDHRKGDDGAPETFWQYIPGDGVYGVPYGTIVPRGALTNWVVGRCFSATHDAHASCRSMGQTMAMGQAAGLAAIISLEKDLPANGMDVALLQDRLVRAGAVLEAPRQMADTSRDGWKNNAKLARR